ncbi:MAG: hypothetical protein FJY36_07370, partial [Betaproteobacteria bacterium]|nr:hypothetical protein [Betaproteobacteria bacterium]
MNTVEASSESSSSSPSPSAGQMLRAAREKRGMLLAMLSVRLKVSVRQLEALEADQHEVFKGAAYERALALAVCRQLGVEPAPILAALPPALQSVPIDPKALEARLASVRTHARSHRGKGLSRQVLVLALLMLLGAAALIWWPSTAHHELASSPDNQDPSQVAVPMGQASDPMAFAAPAASAEQVAPAAALASDSTPSKPLAQASAPQVQAAPAGT